MSEPTQNQNQSLDQLEHHLAAQSTEVERGAALYRSWRLLFPEHNLQHLDDERTRLRLAGVLIANTPHALDDRLRPVLRDLILFPRAVAMETNPDVALLQRRQLRNDPLAGTGPATINSMFIQLCVDRLAQDDWI